MKDGFEISVSPEGIVRFIYADDLRELLDEGDSEVRRASNVEPAVGPDGRIGWQADMSPVADGVLLNWHAERADALAEEVEWLRANYL